MADSLALLDKLERFNRNECDDAYLATIDSLKIQLQDLSAAQVLASNHLLKSKLEKLQTAIKDIETKLLTVRKLSELERENLLDRKELYLDFINSFQVERQLDEIAKFIEQL